jgi:hypothetical protein
MTEDMDDGTQAHLSLRGAFQASSITDPEWRQMSH